MNDTPNDIDTDAPAEADADAAVPALGEQWHLFQVKKNRFSRRRTSST